MTVYFISDCHLSSRKPTITAIFQRFINDYARNADALYILGDLFDTWIGDDVENPLTRDIARSLKNLSQSVPIYFMRGNRDFLIGEQFLSQSGCQYLLDGTVIDLYGQPTLLMHGDLLCSEDIAYQRYRTKIRQPHYQQRFLALPIFIRKSIAGLLRLGSRYHQRNAVDIPIDVSETTVIDTIQSHNVHQLIHGHTHRCNIHEHRVGDRMTKRIVLGAWHQAGNALCYTKDGTHRWIRLQVDPTDQRILLL